MGLTRTLAFALAAIPGTALGQANGITNLGELSPGFGSTALGVSGDGSVVVGYAFTGSVRVPFRWTSATGMVSLGQLNGGVIAGANAVSGNGGVIVGEALDGSFPFRAFRWTQATGLVSLGVLNGGISSSAFAVNADGSVVVGMAADGAALNFIRAFRWTQAGGMISLGALTAISNSVATGVNSDGSVIVGASSHSRTEAFRWTQATGMVGLGFLNGGDTSAAKGVNGDGTVIVGSAHDGAIGNRAFQWTQATGMVSLGVLNGGTDSFANAVSGDGRVIVGNSDIQGTVHAFRWTQATGMQTVEDWLRANGVSVPADITADASGVNSDGSVVVGRAVAAGAGSEFAFLARVSAIGNGLITLADLQQSLSGNAITGPQAASLGGMVLNGAHSRPLEHRAEAGKSCLWTAGDVGRDDHGERDGNFGLAEVGVCHAIARNLQGSLSLGATSSRQILPFNGRSDVQGTYGMVELLGNVSGTKLWPSAALLYQQGDADVRRGYLNAGVQDYSSGRPDVQTTAVRLRVDWEDAISLGRVSIAPYADASYASTRIDAYTETGGGFPARFEERTEKTTEARLGAGASYPWSSSVRLLGQLEAAHRFEKTGASTSGTVLGLFSFELPGQQNDRDWLRAGLGLAARLGAGVLTAMANATTQGAVPSYWLNLSYQVSF